MKSSSPATPSRTTCRSATDHVRVLHANDGGTSERYPFLCGRRHPGAKSAESACHSELPESLCIGSDASTSTRRPIAALDTTNGGGCGLAATATATPVRSWTRVVTRGEARTLRRSSPRTEPATPGSQAIQRTSLQRPHRPLICRTEPATRRVSRATQRTSLRRPPRVLIRRCPFQTGRLPVQTAPERLRRGTARGARY